MAVVTSIASLTAAPELQILAITPAADGVALNWTDLGSAYTYTVESRDSLSGGQWQPCPLTGGWPTQVARWKDARSASAGTRYYRIVAAPVPVQRGKLIASKLVKSWSSDELAGIFKLADIGVTPEYGVEFHKLTYETVDPFGARTTASGALALPVNPTRAAPLVSYQHGTITLKTDVPSALSAEAFIGIVLGATGYAAASPDYLGLGDSPGFHPYHHAKSEATATIDLLRAARAYCQISSIALNGQLFLCGYSQGGHATMATHRELETFHTNEFTLTASAPMAGAYDLSGTTANDFLSGRTVPNPYYFVYLLAAYQEAYHLADSLAAMLASPYDTALPPLLDGSHDSGQINAAMGTASPIHILKPEYLEAFKNSSNHPLRVALRDNDLYAWTPRARMRMYHCHGDQDVIYVNSEVAYNSFIQRGATQVQLMDPDPLGDHGGCAMPSLLGAKDWFDSLRE